jgi:DNA-binding beta-propeller fold protein YncE
MIRRALQAPLRGAIVSLLAAGCGDEGTKPTPAPIDWDAIDPIVFSEHVLPVFEGSCNTAECHNASDRAHGLSLANHGDVAAGSGFGAVVLPFVPDRSHLILHMTGAIEPRMPIGRDPLDEAVIRFLRRWITQGARNDAGMPMYGDVVSKAFIACQGENEVVVLDLATGLLIRSIPVNSPHSVYVDVPNRRVFVSRFENASDNLHVYDADTLELLATGRSGTFPALMRITPDGSQLWVTNFETPNPTADHRVHVLDPDTLEEIAAFQAPFSAQQQPHGLAMTADGATVYVTNILTDNLSIFCTTCDGGMPDLVEFDVQLPAAARAVHQPQQCILSGDETRLFVSALGSDRVYVMNTADLTFPGEVVVGDGPWHLALSPDGTELWVANWLGESVSVVDVSDPDAPVVTATLAPGHPQDPARLVLERPIGIAFSPDGNRVWVACANDDGQGSGHHPAPEGEKNPGNVVVFDRSTREVVSVTEVPYFARFVGFLP